MTVLDQVPAFAGMATIIEIADPAPERLQHAHHGPHLLPYRGTLITRKRTPPGPYRRPMARVLWGSYGAGRFFISKVHLYLYLEAFHLEDTQC